MHLGAGAHEDHVRLDRLAVARRFGQHVAATERLGDGRPQRRQVLAGQDERRRPLAVVQRRQPRPGRLHRVGRADDGQIGNRSQGHDMLHRLVGRPVLTHADAVVGEDVDDRRFHQRRQANGRPHVVGEDQERAAIGTHAAVQGHAVEDAAHGVFAHAEANVAAGEVTPPQVAGPLQVGLVRRRQVARAAQQRR